MENFSIIKNSPEFKCGLGILDHNSHEKVRVTDDAVEYCDCGTQTWYRVGLEDVVRLGRLVDEGIPEIWSTWCATTVMAELDPPEDA